MSSDEVFARFVGRFVEWTKNQATNNRYGYETKFYNDKFTERQYREFVKLLQEKSHLDTTGQVQEYVNVHEKSSENKFAKISNNDYNKYGHVKEFNDLNNKTKSEAHKVISPLAAKFAGIEDTYSVNDVNGNNYVFEIFDDGNYRIVSVEKYNENVGGIINERNPRKNSRYSMGSSELNGINITGNNESNKNRTTSNEYAELSSKEQTKLENRGTNKEQIRNNQEELDDSSFFVEERKNDQIQGLEDYTKPQIKNITTNYIKNALGYANVQADIVGMEIIGSRNRGTARLDNDLDIVVELKGDNLREDDLFNLLNDNDEPLEINGIKVDINPIIVEKSGTLKEFMKRSNEYDKENTRYSTGEEKNDLENNVIDSLK